MTVLRRFCVALCWPILLLTTEQCISSAAPCQCDSNSHQHQSVINGQEAFYQTFFDRNIKLQLGFPSDGRSQISKPECVEVNANPKYLQCKIILPQNEEQKSAVINVAPLIVSLDGQYQTPIAKSSIIRWPDQLQRHPIIPSNLKLPQLGRNLLQIISDYLVTDIIKGIIHVIKPPGLSISQTVKPDITSQQVHNTTEDVHHTGVPPKLPTGITSNEQQNVENPTKQPENNTNDSNKPNNNIYEINKQNSVPTKEVGENAIPSSTQKNDTVFLEQSEDNKNKTEEPKSSDVRPQENASSLKEEQSTSPSNSNGRRSNSDTRPVYDNEPKANSNEQSNVFLLPTKYPLNPPFSGFKSENDELAANFVTTFNSKPQEFRDVPQVANIKLNHQVNNVKNNLRKNFVIADSSFMKAVEAAEFTQPLTKNEMKNNNFKIPFASIKKDLHPPRRKIKIMLQDNGGNRRKYDTNDLAVFLKSLGIKDNASKVKIILNSFANSPYLTMNIENILLAYRAGSVSRYTILRYVIFKLVQNQARIKLLSPGEESRMYEVLVYLGTPISFAAEELKANRVSYGRPSSFFRPKPFVARPQIIPQLSRPNTVIRYAMAPPAPPVPPGYPVPSQYMNRNYLSYF